MACISLRSWLVYVGDLVSLGCVVRSVVWELVQIAKPVTKFEVRQRKWQRRGLSWVGHYLVHSLCASLKGK